MIVIIHIQSGCLVSATPITVYPDPFGNFHIFFSQYEDVHVVLKLL